MNEWIIEKPQGVLIRVKVRPRSKKNMIEGPTTDGRLSVRLTAPPVDDKANAALITLIAKKLHAPKGSIIIQAGARSRNKTLFIEGSGRQKVIKALS